MGWAVRIRCCDTAVWIEADHGRHEVAPQQALLLRLLLLWPGERVSQDLACHVLNIMRSGIGTYVANLRRELADSDAIKSRSGFLTLAWDREDTDAAHFKRLVNEALKRADGRTFDSLDIATATEIEGLLDQAFAIWRGSPATGLDAAVAREPDPAHVQNAYALRNELTELDLVVSEWIEYWTAALLLRGDCRITEGRGVHLAKKAIPDLMRLARNPDPPYDVWPKLFAATAKAQDRRRLREAWRLCEESFAKNGEEIPAEIRAQAPGSESALSSPYRPNPPAPVARAAPQQHGPQQDGPQQHGPQQHGRPDPRIDLMDMLGISTASALRLRGSRLEPQDCIERAVHTLFFGGVLAGKWVIEDTVLESLEKLLTRFDIQDEPGEARFMVLDPASSAYRRLKQMRGGATSVESVNRLVRLSKRFQCLEVRGISHLPAFRLIVIDDDIVSFSPYALENEAYKTSRAGWAAPHVILDPLARWPLAAAFRLHFEESWRGARPLTEEFA